MRLLLCLFIFFHFSYNILSLYDFYIIKKIKKRVRLFECKLIIGKWIIKRREEKLKEEVRSHDLFTYF